MTRQYMDNLLKDGEGFTIEYKKSQGKLSADVFETVSSFSNRYGGHILLGVAEENYNGRKVGQVIGVDKDCIYDIKRDFINILNNPILSEGDIFKTTIPLLSNDDANLDANVANNDANPVANNDANPKGKDETIAAIVLDKITKDPYITQAKLSELTGVSRRTIQRITKALSEQWKLERKDGTRGYWETKGRNSIS